MVRTALLQRPGRPAAANCGRGNHELHARPECGLDASAGRRNQYLFVWHGPYWRARRGLGLPPAGRAGERAAVGGRRRRGELRAGLRAVRRDADRGRKPAIRLWIRWGVDGRDGVTVSAGEVLRAGGR